MFCMGSRLDSHTFTVSYGRELKVMTTVNLFLCCSVFGKNFQANIVLLYSRQNIFILMVKEVFCFRKQMQWSIFTSGEKENLLISNLAGFPFRSQNCECGKQTRERRKGISGKTNIWEMTAYRRVKPGGRDGERLPETPRGFLLRSEK